MIQRLQFGNRISEVEAARYDWMAIGYVEVDLIGRGEGAARLS